jgi:hypothetical protein
MATHYYERDVTGGIVRWQPDNEQFAYEAIVNCPATDPDTVPEAKSQCPISIKDDEHAAIREEYDALLNASKS